MTSWLAPFVAHSLEGMADHATNIAEDVLFLSMGIDARQCAESRKFDATDDIIHPASTALKLCTRGVPGLLQKPAIAGGSERHV